MYAPVLQLFILSVTAWPLLPWSPPNPIQLKQFSSFSFSVVPCLFTAPILLGPPQYSFTCQVKNNSAYRILLLKHDWRQIPSSAILRKKYYFFKDCKMLPLPRRCFHGFLMACYIKGSREVMPFNIQQFCRLLIQNSDFWKCRIFLHCYSNPKANTMEFKLLTSYGYFSILMISFFFLLLIIIFRL